MHSHHNNHHEDRKFGFVCRSTPAIDRNRCHWTNYLNSFDQELDFTKGNIAITGAESYHNNHHEDRRWKLRYCYLRNGYVAFSCGKTGYVNGFDQDISYSVPKDRILTGMNSYHSNKHE